MDVAVTTVSTQYPRGNDKIIQYGTAGFRSKYVQFPVVGSFGAEDLPHILSRMGLLAVLRSKLMKASIGVMITASHNPAEDNGVKLVDPHGEMLEMSWEKHATTVANASDKQLSETLSGIVEQEKIDMTAPATVLAARDTRPSSEGLCTALEVGVKALDGVFVNYGLLTTPQLHYMVRCKNTDGTPQSYGETSEDGYYKKLSAAFIKLQNSVKDTGKYSSEITVDTANGVGGEKLRLLSKHLGESLSVKIVNDGTTGALNYKCGADYVKVSQCAPEGVTLTSGNKYASYDGDADRIVYFFQSSDGTFNLLDGDKIATLVAGYIMSLLRDTGLELSMGLVQTAYANGSSTKYINDQLKVPVACVATGVKYLQKKATEFDIGVYFEANGHGTVLFSDQAESSVKAASEDSSKAEDRRNAASKLLTVIDLINQTVGDALSDMLLVEMILCQQGWDVLTWKDCYTDLPNRQLKVKVKDRTVIKTIPDETKTIQPAALQPAIDAIVAKYNCGRSFARPSGTEDIVRVYAEADTQASADELGLEVSRVVYDHAGGIGDRP